ncbi:hypothetical protein N665_0143s0023 [Sinapis alba]|nr:hypothetical protein N665_0143s0023 [Sinapis alba]
MISLFPSYMSYRIIWMIFVIPSCVYSASELHRLCSARFICGNQEGLFYPFWISGREACGHPDFKLNCSGGFAELTISSAKFIILEANTTTRVVRLARSDYIGDLCPPYPLNSPPFNEYVLPFATGTEIMTIYYGCPEVSQTDSTYLSDLDCDEDGHGEDDENNYYVSRNLSSLSLREICKSHVSIPADGRYLNTLQSDPTLGNLKKVIVEGFTLGANRECSTCVSSKGACGFNQSSNGFVCYCIDGHQNVTCGSTNWDTGLSTGAKAGLSTGKKAGIGTALGLVGIILIAGGLFCIFSRRKKTKAAQYISKDLVITSSSKEASNNPTSTTVSYTDLPLLPSVSTSLANRSVYFGVQVFSYEELEEATQNFSTELGDGGFGTVYYGVLKDGRAVAVKRLYERSLKHVEQFKNEVEILKSLKHPNLVILYGCTSRHSKELLLVYEYISNGTLADHLHGDRAESRPLCWSVRLNVAIETASGLTFLHASGIIHRDVKTTNILLDENYTVKVADFGLSRLFPMDQTHVSTAPQGTPGYVDPEYFQCYRLNEKSDVYSFGVVLIELISSKEAVDITRQSHDINLAKMAVAKIQNNALHELVDPSLGFEKDPEVRRKMMSVAELAFRCLQHEREMRPTMDEVLKILRGIKEQIGQSSPDVVDIGGYGGDDVGLLRLSVPPPMTPETDTWTSSSEDMEAIPF